MVKHRRNSLRCIFIRLYSVVFLVWWAGHII